MDAESESLIAVMQSKLIDQVRRIARTLHVAKRTEEAYVGWISTYLIHHQNQPGNRCTPSQKVLETSRRSVYRRSRQNS
jgi:hypothetical protein